MSCPMILNVDGRVVDGMHRVAHAVLEGALTILSVGSKLAFVAINCETVFQE
jgi:hypothetical protein